MSDAKFFQRFVGVRIVSQSDWPMITATSELELFVCSYRRVFSPSLFSLIERKTALAVERVKSLSFDEVEARARDPVQQRDDLRVGNHAVAVSPRKRHRQWSEQNVSACPSGQTFTPRLLIIVNFSPSPLSSLSLPPRSFGEPCVQSRKRRRRPALSSG